MNLQIANRVIVVVNVPGGTTGTLAREQVEAIEGVRGEGLGGAGSQLVGARPYLIVLVAIRDIVNRGTLGSRLNALKLAC